MDWKTQVNKLYSRKAGRKARRFRGAFGAGYGPAYPMSGNFDMSSVPGGPAGDGGAGSSAGDGGMAGGAGAIGESIEDDYQDDLMMSDEDKLLCALQGIIENAKAAYEAVSGVPYDSNDNFEGK